MTATPLYSQLKLVSLLRRSFTSPDIRKRSKRPTSFSIPPDTHMKLANDSNGPSSDHLHESHIPSMDSDAVLGAVVLPHCLAFLSLSSLLLGLATTPSRCCCIWTGDHSTVQTFLFSVRFVKETVCTDMRKIALPMWGLVMELPRHKTCINSITLHIQA